ncbi:MAG: Uncharacterised protein [Synechococcus sp. MIT S9220]|nr:MAG: Uncharacterised protein [Synechococcus sp. MIT S9220]
MHAAHILEAHQTTPISGAQHHGLEVLHTAQSALKLNSERELLSLWCRLSTDLACRHKAVLTFKLIDDIGRCETEGGELVGVQPQPECQFAIAEIGEIADAAHPLDGIGEVQIQQATDRLRAVGEPLRILAAEVVDEQDRV